jgi:L-iditol 2-dehydrogenase
MNTMTIPKTMRAAVYRGVNDVGVETVPVPEIGPGEVLVHIHACGICGTDLKKIHTGSHSAPRIFGHEMAGRVAAVGTGVTDFKVGDRVMAFHHIPCGTCYYCRKQTFAQCETYKKVGTTAGFAPAGGGFAEYIRVMDWIVKRGLVKIPDGVPFEQAAWIEPVNTCFKAVKLLNLQPDETVLVIGQGPIGILLGALVARTGAKVLTSDLYAERHNVAARFGLKHPLDARSDVGAACKAVTEGRGADVALVAVGADALIRTAMDAVRPGGRVMLFASTQHGETVIDPAAVCMDEKTLMGSYSSSVAIQDEGVELVLDGYRNGFDLTRLISHRFALEEAVAAIDLASHPQPDSMKIFVRCAEGE